MEKNKFTTADILEVVTGNRILNTDGLKKELTNLFMRRIFENYGNNPKRSRVLERYGREVCDNMQIRFVDAITFDRNGTGKLAIEVRLTEEVGTIITTEIYQPDKLFKEIESGYIIKAMNFFGRYDFYDLVDSLISKFIENYKENEDENKDEVVSPKDLRKEMPNIDSEKFAQTLTSGLAQSISGLVKGNCTISIKGGVKVDFTVKVKGNCDLEGKKENIDLDFNLNAGINDLDLEIGVQCDGSAEIK